VFGPNSRVAPGGTAPHQRMPYFHHREPTYRQLLVETTDLFRNTFGFPEEYYDVLFMTGSGTLANESVIWSLTGGRIRVVGPDGEFTSRLRRLVKAHGRGKITAYPHYAMVAYETGESRVVKNDWPAGPSYGEGVRFADCISAFPYYAPPLGTDVFTTVSSKQLGAAPILGIVVVKRSAWRWFLKPEASYSYLNLARWREAFAARRESPHTPALSLLWDLRQRLEGFDVTALVKMINQRREQLKLTFGAPAVLGDGPVATVLPSTIDSELAKKWNLYRSALGWQFFLYSGTDAEFAQFLDEWQIWE